MRAKSLQGIYFIGTILLLGVTLVFSYTNFIASENLFAYWIATYITFAIIIYLKLRQGIIYHPVVLVGSAYYLLLIAGSLTYIFFKERPLNIFTFNLIGVGFSALMGGILLGDSLGTPQTQSGGESRIYNVKIIYLLAMLGIMASIIMFIKFKGLPIFAVNPNDAKVNFLSGNGVLNLFFKGIPVFALALLYERHSNGKSLDIAHIYCGLMMLIILAAGYRSTTLISFGEYVMLYLILSKTKISTNAIAVAGLLAVLFLTFWGSFRRGNEGFEGIERELDIVINARPVIFETIVRNFETEDFFNGSLYYTDFKRFLPGVQVNANVDLKYAIFPNAEAMPDIAGITPSIAGEAYMNFGQRGVYWVLLIVGLLLGIFYRSFKAYPNFFRTATFLTFVFGMADAVQTGIGLKLVHLTQFWIWTFLIGIILETEIVFRKKYLNTYQ